MNLNPAPLLDPVFHFLDEMLKEYGVYFYLVFVWFLCWRWPGCSATDCAENFPINRTSVPASAMSYSHTHQHRRHRRSSSTNMTRRILAWIEMGSVIFGRAGSSAEVRADSSRKPRPMPRVRTVAKVCPVRRAAASTSRAVNVRPCSAAILIALAHARFRCVAVLRRVSGLACASFSSKTRKSGIPDKSSMTLDAAQSS
jgi:hypothetical protein